MIEVLDHDPCPCRSGAVFEACCKPRLSASSVNLHTSAPPAIEFVPNVPEWRYDMAVVRLPYDAHCAAPKCTRTMPAGAVAFVDRTRSAPATWCYNCGACERYARRKAHERSLAIVRGMP